MYWKGFKNGLLRAAQHLEEQAESPRNKNMKEHLCHTLEEIRDIARQVGADVPKKELRIQKKTRDNSDKR